MSGWLRKMKLVGEFLGWEWAGLTALVLILATLTTMIIADNVALRRENKALMKENVELQINNWKLGTAVNLCSPDIKSIYVEKR